MTVLDNSARQMGELAARLLLTRLEQPDSVGGNGTGTGVAREFSEFRVGGRLVERDSCRALPPGSR
jgi:DNA-binding LacI/PurR family transcriptional regulator